MSRVLSHRCKSLSAVDVIANLRRPVGSVQNDRFLFNPFTTIVACPVEEDAGIAVAEYKEASPFVYRSFALVPRL